MSTLSEKGERNVGREGLRDKRTERRQEREEEGSSPFYSELDTPGWCQVTMRQSLDRGLT